MPAVILSGNELAEEIKHEIEIKVKNLEKKPGLAVVLVGDDPASKLYTSKKQKMCEEIGIYSEKHELEENVLERAVIELIEKLNHDEKIHGILVQVPLPGHIDANKVMQAIDPKKDVDGFHPINMGNLFIGNEELVPCTPKGIIKLMENYKIDPEAKNIVIIGKGNIAGKPLAALLSNRDATVTLCHIKSKNVPETAKSADILISAAGKPRLVTADMVKEDAVVIDIGINKENDKIVGDVDFDKVKDIASHITPVPGGVGPMTIAMLMENLLICYEKSSK